ncbi:MAG: enoyl-CoA hydratase [Reyranellaceae bacterium]
MSGNVRKRVDRAIGWIEFDNAEKRNAMSLQMFEELFTAMDELSRASDVRVIALRGAGTRAFVSGADISEFDALRSVPEQIRRYDDIAERAYARLREIEKPTVAMINGYCIGGGMAIALECDLRICSHDAQFAIPAARLGLGYRESGVRKLVEMVGPTAAKEIFFTAGRYSADEMLALGLVNRVVQKSEIEKFATEYCDAIARNAPLTIAAAKKAVNAALSDPRKTSEAVDACINACFASEDYKEGRRAFLEKRSPIFRGF